LMDAAWTLGCYLLPSAAQPLAGDLGILVRAMTDTCLGYMAAAFIPT
jgi:hypothetical protein